jgi:PAS domain S-box-containing protein
MIPRRVALLIVLTAIYFAAGRLGLSLAFVNESASAVWPPTGIAIAACLLAGSWVWPAVFVGACLVNFATSGAVGPSILIGCGNAAEAVLAASLVRRFSGDGAAAFRTTIGILAYTASVVVASTAAAAVGLLALLAGDLLGNASPSMVWLTWWTGDLASAVLLTPAIVMWARPPSGDWRVGRLAEGAALVVILLGATYWIFGPSPSGIRSYPLMFLTLPVLLWAGLRFGPLGVSAVMPINAAAAASGTLAGYGPFSALSPNESLLLLQAYLIVKMVVMLTLAAEVDGRRAVERDIRQMNASLERRIESRMQDIHRLHGRLVEAQAVAHIGSWEWDVATDAIWWSDEMYRVYGLPIGEPISFERYISMVHPDDRAAVQEIVASAARTGDAFTFEHRAVLADGSIRTLHAQGRVVLDEDGRVVRMLGIGHDITDRKRAEEERIELAREQAARREAEEASRAKDHFLATLSHELRTPLNAVVGWGQILKNARVDEPLRQKAIEAINRNVTIQAQLVSDILDVARIRTGVLSIDPRPVSLRPIVEAALEIMRGAIAAKGITVSIDIPHDAAVMGDGQRLQQVCWNMLSNAAKFVPTGGTIVVTGAAEGEIVCLTIEDDGPGIPDSFLPHVFEQFSQADASLTREHGGLGLGLAIAHTLVQLHGGRITAGNRPQGGAIFTVELPAAPRTAPV